LNCELVVRSSADNQKPLPLPHHPSDETWPLLGRA
jgi:hypothetical protein